MATGRKPLALVFLGSTSAIQTFAPSVGSSPTPSLPALGAPCAGHDANKGAGGEGGWRALADDGLKASRGVECKKSEEYETWRGPDSRRTHAVHALAPSH